MAILREARQSTGSPEPRAVAIADHLQRFRNGHVRRRSRRGFFKGKNQLGGYFVLAFRDVEKNEILVRLRVRRIELDFLAESRFRILHPTHARERVAEKKIGALQGPAMPDLANAQGLMVVVKRSLEISLRLRNATHQ